MKFRGDQPIFQQIIAHIENRVIDGTLPEDERVPAVREYAIEVEVNPNTVVRSFAELEDAGVIYKKRGLGYFVSPDARDKILQRRKRHFLEHDLPATFHAMRLLDIDLDDVANLYEKYKKGRLKGAKETK